MGTIYDGDVQIEQSIDGGAITFHNGQPVMDEGLSTVVYTSLYTESGWWGDAIQPPADRLADTPGPAELEALPLTGAVRKEYETRAAARLAWMTRDGVAASVTCSASILSPWALELAVTIEEPSGKTETYRYRRYWQAQHAKFK